VGRVRARRGPFDSRCGLSIIASVSTSTPEKEERAELATFAFLAFVLAPVLAIVGVGAFGFAVWVWQMINGPPGPPPS
jgi:nitrate reductase NapE